MQFKDAPIQHKLMRVILLTSGAVLLVTCAAFFAYEFITFRQTTVRQLSTVGEIIAANSTAALAFDNRDDANEILASLKAERHIVAAGLYDTEGNLFSHYPANLPINTFPKTIETEGYYFVESHLIGFEAVVQGSKRLGTLYLKSDMAAMVERFQLYGLITVLVITLSFLLAYLLSRSLQKGISKPILALAETAKGISIHQDYSIRAIKMGDDELGLLTDSFNQMLEQIQDQNLALSDSEARLRSVLNSAMSAVIIMDSDGIITDWNLRAEKIFGWTPKEIIGKELAETIVPKNFRSAHRQGLQHFMSTGEGPVINQLLEMSALRSDGSLFPVELSISVLKAGDVVSFCGFVSDITERKKAEDEIHKLNEELEQKVNERTAQLASINKELEAFTYSVSHDLRAPLRSINGYTQILEDDYGKKIDEEGKRVIRVIIKNAQRMGQLVDDLLDFSRVGRKELTKSNVNMIEIVQDVVNELTAHEEKREIEMSFQNHSTSKVDVSMVRQVWVNLISNALKYSRKNNQAKIEIGSYDAGNEACYYVKDNGVGFDMKYVHKLFEVFQRLHSMQEFEGTGVGLALVKRIISRHGGRVWVEAKINEGATFYFSIPNENN